MKKPIPTLNDPWVRWARLIGVLFVSATVLALLGCGQGNKVWGDPAYVVTDAGGCQYITTWKERNRGYGGTPRMDRDGKQVCK